MKILLIDFYDSFTYNLKHYLESLHSEVNVLRHDDINDINILDTYSHIILSPGPGMPAEKKNMFEIISFCDGKIQLLGICLGMQAIGCYLGGTLENMPVVRHGVSDQIIIEKNRTLFCGLPNQYLIGLYHSWSVIDIDTKYIDAKLNNGRVMAISDVSRKLYGVQFHPESVLSEYGKELLSNFLNKS